MENDGNSICGHSINYDDRLDAVTIYFSGLE